ncbi:MAG: hypothetical protein R2879_10195 [Saprospiraceae bacterium]
MKYLILIYFLIFEFCHLAHSQNILYEKEILDHPDTAFSIFNAKASKLGGIYLMGNIHYKVNGEDERIARINKFDSNGNLEWFLNLEEGTCYDLLEVDNDLLVLTDKHQESFYFPATSILKFNSQNQLIQKVVYPFPENGIDGFSPARLLAIPNGYLVMGRSSDAPPGDTTNQRSFLNFDNDLNFQWKKFAIGTGDNYLQEAIMFDSISKTLALSISSRASGSFYENKTVLYNEYGDYIKKDISSFLIRSPYVIFNSLIWKGYFFQFFYNTLGSNTNQGPFWRMVTPSGEFHNEAFLPGAGKFLVSNGVNGNGMVFLKPQRDLPYATGAFEVYRLNNDEEIDVFIQDTFSILKNYAHPQFFFQNDFDNAYYLISYDAQVGRIYYFKISNDILSNTGEKKIAIKLDIFP